jgi:hypothetical protein
LKKFATLAVALVATLGLTGAAIAQYVAPVVSLTGSVSPSKGGTKKKPKKGEVKLAFTVNKESRVSADQIVFLTPANVKLSGKGFRYCPQSFIAQNGVAKCPKGSQIGTGTASAVLGPRQAPLEFTTTVFWGSVNEITVYLEQKGGNLKVPLTGPVTAASAPYGQKVTIDIPPQVVQPAPGVFSQITGVDVSLGGQAKKKVKKKTKKFFTSSVTGCPKDRTHDFQVRLRFVSNGMSDPNVKEAQASSTQNCKK